MSLISLKKVCKNYRLGKIIFSALRGINLEVNKGDFIALMGPSGSGKSTLMNIIGCLDVPTSGQYFLDNQDISKKSQSQLAKIRGREIGFVFQTFNLLPRTTVAKNVELPLIYLGLNGKQRQEKVLTALKKVGLESRLNHKSNELSGGETQRVAIARALVTEPKVVLADEPTGNLDSKNGEEILKLLGYLNKQGVTIVMVTHDAKIAGYAQKIINILDGQIL
ncbi:MAG: ABC transporter ATP-binding protein [Patescibacteria group bacterium]